MNILIVRVSAIGDIIHTFPALFYLKNELPQAKISWVVQAKGASLLEGQPFIDKTYTLPNSFLRFKNLGKTKAVIKELRKTKWDAIIDFQGLTKTSLLYCWLSGKKFGFAKPHAREGIATLFTHHQVKPVYEALPPIKNIIQKNLTLASHVVKALGRKTSCPSINSLKKRFAFNIPQEKKANVVLQGLGAKKNLITLAPNTTWPSKHWPLEHWKKLLLLLTKEAIKHGRLALLGKDFGEQGKALAQFIQEQNLPIILIPPVDLLSVASILQHSKILVAPDTGILHLADFLGVETIGLFGPTLAERHGPFLTEKNIRNAIQVPCPHRYKKQHEEQNCMEQLSPEKLCQTILRLGNP